MKARVYKDHGDIDEALKHMEEGRMMDLADRYLNNKASRYLLRAGKIEEGRKMISIFTKAVPSEMITEYNNVYDLQVNWYTLEEGDAWRRNGNLSMALKRYNDVLEHFTQYYNDEFDYHSYCLRKNTLRGYMNTIKLHDRVRDHPFWFSAASKSIELFLHLTDSPSKPSEVVDKELEGLSDQERKKVLAKRRKAKAQKEREEAEKREKEKKSLSSKKRQGHYDPDPDAQQFLEGKNYLEEADKLAKILVINCADRIKSHLLAFDVALRRDKYLQALKALNKSIALGSVVHPQVHYNIVAFGKKVPTVAASLNEEVRAIVNEAITRLGASDPKKYNEDFLNKNRPHLLARLAYVRSALLIDAASLSAVELNDLFEKDAVSISTSFEEVIEVHKFLLAQKFNELATKIKADAAARYPIPAYFKTEPSSPSSTQSSS
jgi:peptide alpha-N-acetyltransferase